MAELRPFKGFRFRLADKDALTDVIAPPYDMLDDARVDDLYRKSPTNVVRIDANRREQTDRENRDRHVRAAEFFKQWVDEGRIFADERPGFYIYEQRFSAVVAGKEKAFVRTGVIAQVKLVDFDEKIVLPHEYTLSGPKADRLEHLEETKLNVGQIFGLISDEIGSVYTLICHMKKGEELGTAVDGDGVHHILYRSTDNELNEQLRIAAKESSILIADGHHRYETALNFYHNNGNDPAYSHIMMTLVSMADPGLMIRSFHRLIRRQVIDNLAPMKTELERFYSVTDLGRADSATVYSFLQGTLKYGMLFVDSDTATIYGLSLHEKGEAFLAKSTSERSSAWKHLDMAQINMIVIEAILNLPLDGKVLHDVVEYSHDVETGLKKSCDKEYYGGFFIKPVDIETIHTIVKGGERMPQKSTNFYPKLYSGLVINNLKNL